MKKLKIVILFLLMFFCVTGGAYSFDILSLFRHSETAEKNSLFADIGLAPFMIENFEFSVLPFSLKIDYMLPVPLPFSFGIFLTAPFPNFKHFGLRLSYHFDVFDHLTDFYLAYSFDFGFLRNDLLLEYNDTPVEIHYYDFRIGLRRFFRSRLGFAIETGFKFDSVTVSFTIKIN